MRLAFARSLTDSELIASGGRSHFHTELVFSNGDWFSARPRGGVEFWRHGIPANYDFISLWVPVEQEAAARKWAESVVGEPYDWCGYRGAPPSPSKKWCSLACCLACQQTGWFLQVEGGDIHADEFYALACVLGGKA